MGSRGPIPTMIEDRLCMQSKYFKLSLFSTASASGNGMTKGVVSTVPSVRSVEEVLSGLGCVPQV